MAQKTNALATAFVNIVPSTEGLGKAIQKDLDGELDGAGQSGGKALGGGILSSLKGFAAPIAATLGTFAVADFFKDSVKAASDLSESQNAIKVTFGAAADEIAKLGETSAKRLGLSTSSFNGIAVQFSSFAQRIAGEGGNITGVIDQISQRGADFASVMNIDVSEALGAFQSGLAGETEPLKRFGIDLSEAAVQQYALSSGLWDGQGAMSESMKVQARYGSLLQQTDKVAGDFANTSDGLANGQRILSAQFEDGKAKLGNALLPAMAGVVGFLNDKAIPGFNAFVDALKGAWAWVQGNSHWIVPITIAVTGFAAALALAGFQAKIAAAGGLVQFFTALLNGSTIMRVVTAAQWLWNAALAANPIGLIITAVAGLVAALVYFFTQTDLGRQIWQGFVDFLGQAWTWLWESVLKPVFDFIGAAFTWLFENVIRPYIQLVILQIMAWGAIFSWLYDYVVKPVFGFIGDIFAWIYENIIKPTVDRIVQSIKVWGDIFNWLHDHVVKPVFDAIGAAFQWIWNNVIRPVADWIMGAIHTIGDTVSSVFGGIASVVRSAFDGLIGIIRGPVNAVIGFMNSAIDGINKIRIDIPEWARQFFGGATKLGFNIPRIPALAAGGYVDKPTTALIGEAGPEVVTPLKDFERMMGIGSGNGQTINYYAAPNQSLDAEAALLQAIKRSKVLAAW